VAPVRTTRRRTGILRAVPDTLFDIAEQQRILPPGGRHRFEGIAFSPDGSSLAVATSESNTVFLYRRTNGRFDDAPSGRIEGPDSGLDYPHDVAFSAAGDLMAVAQRKGAITVYPRRGESFAADAEFVIRGAETRLNFSDGVAFVPPDGDSLAACNLENDSISFYRMLSRAPLTFELSPSFELKHPAIFHPDGLGFSECGRWLAVANHGGRTVAVFERAAGTELRYGPKPVTVIRHRSLRYPHSVAFTPGSNHLLVTNAGANYFSIFEHDGKRWSRSPAARRIVGPDRTFREVNARCKMEGGPKGIAIHGDHVAICSPEQGIVIYALRDRPRKRFWPFLG
jgi:DNA-binding beta-propeller fold protein YncE